MKIAGQGAVVTGGASGLGLATARKLAEQGARVAIVDRDATAAEAAASEIGGLALIGDVADAQAMEAALARAQAAHGPCRTLVNCAGVGAGKRIVGRDGPMPLDDFERVIRVNLIGSFNMMRLAAAQMAQAPALDDGERGVIVSTASVAAYEGQIGQAAYAASKGGIVSLTLPAAREFAPLGVRVLAIAPGLFLTPLMRSLSEDIQQSLARSIPFPARLGLAEEFAALVAHMVENRYLNGEVVRLDGALRMQPK